MKPKMSPKRRFLSAMMGGKADRMPVGNVVSTITLELMEASGAWYPHVHLNAGLMATLAATGHEILGFDTVMPVFSVVQEAAAMGCEINWGDVKTNPSVHTHPFADVSDFRVPEGWIEAPAAQTVLDALTILRESLGHDVVIVGKAMGPWTLSYNMMGTEEFLMTTAADPDRARASLHALKSVTIEFAKAQMQAGADVICIADHATGLMVSPLVYRDMLLPIHQEIIGEIGCPTVLHCCGNTTDRLQYFAETGFDAYHFESHVDAKTAVETVAGRMQLIGNINNPEVLLQGTPEMVADACRKAIEAGIDILAPECAVPLATPTANLKTIVEVAERYAN
jgi:[methyl-Co(III) methanol-specific corrinoid protein]:coenzyme M methyltransferase